MRSLVEMGAPGSLAAAPDSVRPLILRPRLLETLAGRWERPITALVAGAGFGKTSLLAQAISEGALAPAGEDIWISCGPSADLAAVLGAEIIVALGGDPVGGADPGALADACAAAIAARAPVPTCLVIDELQRVPEGSSAAALLRELLARLPSNGHLLTAGRTPPPLPIARLVAQGRAVVLREDDLTFDEEELTRFAVLRGIDVDALAEVAGWPAIAELTASAGAPMVLDFLWEEVIEGLAPERRRLLALLQALGGADTEDLAAAAGVAVDVAVLLDGLPLATLTDGVAGLHQLWEPALAPVLDDDERRQALRAVAARRRMAGRYPEAWALLGRAGAWEDQLGLVVEVCWMPVPLVDPEVLSDWRRELAGRDPDLPELDLLEGAESLVRAQEPRVAMPALRRALRRFREGGQALGEAASLANAFTAAYYAQDDDLLDELFERVVELTDVWAAGGMHDQTELARAVWLRRHERDHEAVAIFESIPRSALPGGWNTIRDLHLADALAGFGQPEQAVAHLRRWPYQQRDVLGALYQEILVQCLFDTGAVDEAWDLARADLAEGSDLGRLRQQLQVTAAWIAGHLGHTADATRLLAAVGSHGRPGDPWVAEGMVFADAAVAVARGDEQRAASTLGSASPPKGSMLRALALSYVLAPAHRTVLDAAELGPTHARIRDLAAAVVQLRDAGSTSRVARLTSLEPVAVRTALPLPWAVLLAVGAEAADRPEGRALLAELGPSVRPWLVQVAEAGAPPVRRAARRLLADVAPEPLRRARVGLLGPATLTLDGTPSEGGGWRRQRVRELCAWLVLHPGATREEAAEALWPELDGDAGSNNLRTTLSYLFQALQPDRRPKERSAFLGGDERTLVLEHHEMLEIDLWEFARHLEDAEAAERRGSPTAALAAYRAASALWRGPLLGGAATAWADDEQERLRSAFVTAVTRGAELAAAAGEPTEARALAERAVAADPWSERAYRALAAAQLDAGDDAGAALTLRRCENVLAELGVDAEPATRMVEQRLVDRRR